MKENSMTHREVTEHFIESVEQQRVLLGFTQTQMAEKLGMSVSGYKKIVAGETTKVDLYIAFRMYELTGKLLFELCDAKMPELEFFKKYRRLSPSQKTFVEGITDFELDFQIKASDTEEYISVMVPTGNAEDGMLWDSFHIEKVNAAPYLKRFGTNLHCGIKVTSNHMHPVYHIGDILLVCRKPPRDGDTGIFINKEDGCVYIRKFRQTNPCLMEPLNGYGITFKVDSYAEEEMAKWIKYGYVLTKMREV